MIMKKLILLIALFISIGAYSQERQLNSVPKVELEQISENQYIYKSTSSGIKQIGYYEKQEGVLVMTGTWKMYNNGKLIQKCFYNNGILQKIVIYKKRTKIKYSANDIHIAKLRAKVNKLQSIVSTQ